MDGTYTIECGFQDDKTISLNDISVPGSIDEKTGLITLKEDIIFTKEWTDTGKIATTSASFKSNSVEQPVHTYFKSNDGKIYDTCDWCHMCAVTDKNPPGTSCCLDDNCPSRKK